MASATASCCISQRASHRVSFRNQPRLRTQATIRSSYKPDFRAHNERTAVKKVFGIRRLADIKKENRQETPLLPVAAINVRSFL